MLDDGQHRLAVGEVPFQQAQRPGDHREVLYLFSGGAFTCWADCYQQMTVRGHTGRRSAVESYLGR